MSLHSGGVMLTMLEIKKPVSVLPKARLASVAFAQGACRRWCGRFAFQENWEKSSVAPFTVSKPKEFYAGLSKQALAEEAAIWGFSLVQTSRFLAKAAEMGVE